MLSAREAARESKVFNSRKSTEISKWELGVKVSILHNVFSIGTCGSLGITKCTFFMPPFHFITVTFI